ncbi:MAG: AhpC/TSA family protein [Acidobacteriia bacterium]|nr:AhpC/TSA family protein [Terriglobia bacterium]
MKWRGLEESKSGLGHATLKAALDERRALMEQYVPAETQALNRRAVEELRASSIAERILPAGAAAPSFELPDEDGKTVSSKTLLETGPLVVIFLRGRWCPFCVATAEAWNQALPLVRAAGGSLVAISPQTVHQSYLMHEQHNLGFPLLSDAANRVARQFGLVYRMAPYQQEIYSRTFVNLPFINGDASWELPLPAAYVIAPDGRVRYAAADPDYTLRPEPRVVCAHLAG